LSEQITVVLPSVSTEGSLRTTARRAAMRCTPMASAMVTMAGRPSGMAPTASVMAKMTDSRSAGRNATPVSAMARQVPTTSMMAAMTTMPMVMYLPMLCRALVSGVCRSVASLSRVEMRPSSVAAPVPQTMAVAVP
jgi:hypothetical protein